MENLPTRHLRKTNLTACLEGEQYVSGTPFYTPVPVFVVRAEVRSEAEVFMAFPGKNRDFAIQVFCPGYISLIIIVAQPFYTTVFFVRAEEFHGNIVALVQSR